MTNNIQITYRANTKIDRLTTIEIVYYTKEYDTLFQRVRGDNIYDIAEIACETMIQHKFAAADIVATDTHEVLMQLERATKKKEG